MRLNIARTSADASALHSIARFNPAASTHGGRQAFKTEVKTPVETEETDA